MNTFTQNLAYLQQQHIKVIYPMPTCRLQNTSAQVLAIASLMAVFRIPTSEKPSPSI